MEKLSLAILNAVNNKKWLPIKIATMFENFSKVSGLKVNLTKSRALYSKGVTRAKLDKFSMISGIGSTSNLGNYLGFPIFKGRVRQADFDFIIERMQSRLASWKHRFLNKAGRLALASFVLSSLPSYYMQLYWLPQATCNMIDRITREFVWKGTTNKGINVVNRQKVTRPKRLRGLGLRSAMEANLSLLGEIGLGCPI